MKGLSASWLAGLLVTPVLGGGLVGYGIYPYNLDCAFACLRPLSSYILQCSSGIGKSATTSPQCRTGDTPWLTTLAWCMRTECAEYHVATSELEAFREQQCTGDPTVAPNWGYTTSLQHVARPPTQELSVTDETLNTTAIVSPLVYKEQHDALSAVQREVTVESAYEYDIKPGRVGRMRDLLANL